MTSFTSMATGNLHHICNHFEASIPIRAVVCNYQAIKINCDVVQAKTYERFLQAPTYPNLGWRQSVYKSVTTYYRECACKSCCKWTLSPEDLWQFNAQSWWDYCNIIVTVDALHRITSTSYIVRQLPNRLPYQRCQYQTNDYDPSEWFELSSQLNTELCSQPIFVWHWKSMLAFKD